MTFKILVVDDDNLVSLSLKKVLTKFDYIVETCLDASKIDEFISSFQPDIILLDIYLTTNDGIEILKQLNEKLITAPIIMITGYSDVKLAVKAMKLGAYDFLLKPIDLEQLNITLKKCTEKLNLKLEVDKLHQLYENGTRAVDILGVNKQFLKVVRTVEKLAQSDDTTILIEGESGTGKEIFARYIHELSPRKNEMFIAVNCATITRELAESELFGHEKGAFTGASQKTKLGKFELADNATILLDEIGELSLDLQAKLLRVLQEKKFYRLGGEKEISVNVRVIAATNRNLVDEVKKGNFREDLFYRLNVAKITIPSLRDRKDDIPLLSHSFIKEFNTKFNKQVKGLEESASQFLQNLHWKGNVRELKNALERAVLLMDDDDILKVHHLSFLKEEGKDLIEEDAFSLKIPKQGIKIDKVLKSLILQTLQITNGNQVRAAKVLGLSRSKLRYRMEQLGIEVTKKIE